MTPILITAIIVFWIYYIFTHFWKTQRKTQLINKLPGPKPIPVVGNDHLFAVKREELLPVFYRLHEQYGDLFRLWHGMRAGIHIVNPDYAEVILGANNKHIAKGKAYQFLLPWLGTGLLTSTGKKWFLHRKLITPTFHFRVLDGFLDVFNDCSQILVEKLRGKAGNGEFFDVYPFITRCALDIICETAMGTTIRAQDHQHSEFVAATLKMATLIINRNFKIWLHPDYVYYNTQQGKEYLEALKVLHGFTESVIRDRRKARVPEISIGTAKENGGDVGIKRKLAFLDLLLDSAESEKVPLTDVEIREEVDTFMFEGHDTTTAALSWTLLLLGNNPKIQDAAREEMFNIFQGQNRPVTHRDLGEMKLLERIVKETLRLYPSVTIITRILDEDIKLGKFTIPATTNVAIHISAIQRHPKIYENPLKFDPDRFLPENSFKRHPYAYIPFSAGQRNCIGQKFAMMEEKVVLSWILRNYKITALHTPEQVHGMLDLVNRPKEGIHIKLTPL